MTGPLLLLFMFLQMGKLRDVEVIWIGNMEDRLAWNPCGPVSLFVGLCSITVLTLFPLPISEVTFQFSKDKKFLFLVFVVVLVLPFLLLWHLPVAFEFLGNEEHFPETLLHSLIQVAAFERKIEREREKKRMTYFMDFAPLRPSGILIIKAWYSNLSKAWIDWFILGQPSLLKPPLLRLTSFNFFIDSSSYCNKHFSCFLWMSHNRKKKS